MPDGKGRALALTLSLSGAYHVNGLPSDFPALVGDIFDELQTGGDLLNLIYPLIELIDTLLEEMGMEEIEDRLNFLFREAELTRKALDEG